MKKILLIIIFILFSCESSDYGLDVNENVGAFQYYDYIAFGWESFFDGNYTDASSYFNSALKAEDEPYHNSAHVGLGWTYLYYSNSLIDDDELFETYRDSIYDEFSFIDSEDIAIDRYTTYCPHSFCCSTGDCFARDRALGELIYNIEDHFFSNPVPLDIDTYVDNLDDFIINNPTYDFMNGKPTGTAGESLNININNVVVYLAQVYLRLDRFNDACDLLNTHSLSCEDDCNNIDIDSFLSCVQLYSGLYY